MPTLSITRGLPASGKTTLAREIVARGAVGQTIRVNRDDLRRALIDPAYSKPVELAEEAVTRVQRASVRAALESGTSVIVDDTNLPQTRAREWAELAEAVGAHFKVYDLSGVPLDACLARDAARTGPAQVGPDVIRGMYERFLAGGRGLAEVRAKEPFVPVPYAGTPGAQPAVVVDLDGTLALNESGRGWWPGPDGEQRCDEDEPNAPVILAARRMSVGVGSEPAWAPVFMSGRTEACREQTRAWIEEQVGFIRPRLFMRAEGDTRPDDQVKAELFDRHVREHYDVQLVLDDRNSVVAMWRAMGLTCLQVADGDF